MATATTESNLSPLVLRFGPATQRLTDDEFYEFCQSNRDWRIERDSCGDFIIMPPAGGESGRSNADLILQLGLWNKRTKSGEVFDSSTGFSLPNGAIRSPDAAWVRRDRWNALTHDQQKGFPPLAPDFIVELRSETDLMRPLRGFATKKGWGGLDASKPRDISTVQSSRPLFRSKAPLRAKMREYIQRGVRLGWLIDPIRRRVEVFRPGKRPQTLNAPATVSGEPELAAFTLELAPIWSS